MKIESVLHTLEMNIVSMNYNINYLCEEEEDTRLQEQTVDAMRFAFNYIVKAEKEKKEAIAKEKAKQTMEEIRKGENKNE